MLQTIILIDQIAYLSTKPITRADFIYIIDVLMTSIICAYIIINLIVKNEEFYTQFISDNPFYKTVIGIFAAIKAFRFYQIFMINVQIRVVVECVFKVMAFITDILFVILIFFLIFATMGISFYGGNVNSGSQELYEEIYGEELDEKIMIFNFNDYYHSMLTLFIVMMTGWHGWDKLNTLGNEMSMKHNIFFGFFFFFSNMVFLNILFGFLVDNINAYLSEKLE